MQLRFTEGEGIRHSLEEVRGVDMDSNVQKATVYLQEGEGQEISSRCVGKLVAILYIH